MPRRLHLLSLLLVLAALPSAAQENGPLHAGPMLGPVTHRTATVWVQTNGRAEVALRVFFFFTNQKVRKALEELEIHGRGLAALGFQLVLDLGVLIEASQASLLNGGDVNEHVRAAAIGLHKAVALGGVEPLDRTGRHICVSVNALSRQAPRGVARQPIWTQLVQAKEQDMGLDPT